MGQVQEVSPSLIQKKVDSAPESCCWVGINTQRNISIRIAYLYMLALLVSFMVDIKSEILLFFPYPLMRWESEVVRLEHSHCVQVHFQCARNCMYMMLRYLGCNKMR